MIVNKPKKNKESSRYSVLYIIMFIIMGTIVGKLLYLQVYKYDDYKEKADVSSTKFISEEAPRGNIYDSNGNVIATNKQTYTLTYMETVDSTNLFFKTMDKVFQILEDNGEEFQDDLAIKVDENGGIYFDFKTDNESSRRTLEVRFKRDRGLNEDIENKKFGNKEGDYTDEEINEVNDELMKISAEDTFYYLVKSYNLYKLLLPEDYTSEEANELNKKYKEEGLEILGFPCNQFASQDKGSNEEIQEFCSLNYGVTFNMFQKIEVNGENAHPLYKFLKNEKKGLLSKEIKWNFTKFLIDSEGNVVKRYAPTVKPLKIEEDIKKLLK